VSDDRDGGGLGARGVGASSDRRDLLGDDDLLSILEEAIADERAAQEKYRRGLERCADPEACEVFEQLLGEERAHERVLRARYVEVKKRIGLRSAGRG
jgi:rubrerythrin